MSLNNFYFEKRSMINDYILNERGYECLPKIVHRMGRQIVHFASGAEMTHMEDYVLQRALGPDYKNRIRALCKNLYRTKNLFIVSPETMDRYYKKYQPNKSDDWAMGLFIEASEGRIQNLLQNSICENRFILVNGDFSFENSLRCKRAIFICPERIMQMSKKTNIYYTILFMIVFAHELGHAAFDAGKADGSISCKTKEKQANFFASLTLAALRDDVDIYIKRLTEKQPSEYRNPLLVSEIKPEDYDGEIWKDF